MTNIVPLSIFHRTTKDTELMAYSIAKLNMKETEIIFLNKTSDIMLLLCQTAERKVRAAVIFFTITCIYSIGKCMKAYVR